MTGRYDVVIIGMGSAGLIGAEFAATIGVRAAVVERHRVGGDCLWTGCVPSKALLASAKVAHHMRTGSHYGLPSFEPSIDHAEVWKRIRSIQHEIATSDDSPDRYAAMGVEIVYGDAIITGPNSVQVGDRTLDTRFILICTGSRPATPPIPGLTEAGFVTSENLFELEQPAQSWVIIGGGPIAIEMAQGFNRLGLRVTVLQKGNRLLPRDEPELVDALVSKLRAEGVNIRLDVETANIEVVNGRKVVHGTEGGTATSWSGDELLVAAGRKPNVEHLGLEDVGVTVGPRGIEIDERLRTNVPSIYAAGDVAGRFLFTHSAGYEAVRALRDMFFPGKGKVGDFIPWCTFTDPELAHAGLTEAEARERHKGSVEIWHQHLTHSDRARADGSTEGMIKVVTVKGRVVGAHILAPSAGEMIHELALAIQEEMKLGDLANLIHVYPTLSTATGQLAAEAAFEKAERLRWLVRKEK